MKRSTVISLIVALAALILSMMAGGKVNNLRQELVKNDAQQKRVYLPRLGMDKYLADLRWVMLVQQMGQTKGGKMTPEAAAYFAAALETITDLDPEFEMAYTMGAPLIAHEAPAAAVALLEKGVANARTDNWQYSFNLGFIASRLLSKSGVSEAECHKKAVKAYEMAAKSDNAPAYTARSWMFCATRSKNEEPVKELLAQKDFLLKVYADSYTGGEGMSEESSSTLGDDTICGNLSAWLIDRSRSRSNELLGEIQNTKDPVKRKALEADLNLIRAAYDQIRTLGISGADHVCKNCLASYGAGEFFCSSCGKGVAAYGYCKGCYAKGKLVVLHGAYCHSCGGKANNEVAASE